ncbi:MAG: hypothetical protein N2515_04360, partial [Deltaproteobacteria bacterium]|nr:hypothetical protein [Deltaproteobacteria bacterium]
VSDLEPRGDPLMQAIGRLFAPQGGRDGHYRPARFPLHGAGTIEMLEMALARALEEGEGALTLYIAGHGEGGEVPKESQVWLWGEDTIDAKWLARHLDGRKNQRPFRLIATTCYGGGLAEFVFKEGEREKGVAEDERCGLFATTWDEEASGCDPDPDRAKHEGFGVLFLAALQGKDRAGGEIREKIDLDRDGQIGPYEALSWVRINARSVEIPITSSENFLRARIGKNMSAEGPLEIMPLPSGVWKWAERELPEQVALIRALNRESASLEKLSGLLEEIETRKREHDQAMDKMQEEFSKRLRQLSRVALSRWPVLDDPFHPDFFALIEQEGPAIRRFLEESPLALRVFEAEEELE